MNPYLRRLFDAYGPRRCYWGTDMTNSFAKATYRRRITQFMDTLDFLSDDDKAGSWDARSWRAWGGARS
jgi:hypothetical protein